MRRGTMGQERRAMAMPDATVAAEGRQFTGRAVVFDTWTMIGGAEWGFRERVGEGSATKTLRESDVVFLDNHNPDRPISRTSAGTLRLSVDGEGLPVNSDLDTRISYVNDLALNVENRNVKGMSFGFEVVKDEWIRGSDGIDERTIREFKLFEVSATAFPAYTTTDAAVRSAVLTAKIRRGDLTPAEIRRIRGTATRAVAAEADTDDDPNALISAVDAAIDEAIDLHAEGEDDQAWALITSADTTIDKAMALLGIPDPDDSGEPPNGTRSSDMTEPPAGTRAEVALLKRRMAGLKALHGF